MHRQYAYAAHARSGTAPADISRFIALRRTAAAIGGLTGALVYTGEDFFELLEGQAHAVERIVRTLDAEPLLRAPRLLLDRAVPTRWYRKWSAGYVPARLFDPWLAGVAAAGGGDASTDAIKRFLDAARTF